MKSFRVTNKTKRAVNCFSLFTILCSLLFTSCLKESDNGSNEIRFNASIAPHSRAATDAAFKTTWEDGDQIGLFAVRHAPGATATLAASRNYIHNLMLTYDKSTKTLVSNSPIYFPRGGDQLDFYAYYPYDASVTDPTNITFNVSTNQNDAPDNKPNYNRSDLMFSDTTKNVGVETPLVLLAFSHALTMVQLNVDKSYGSLGKVTVTTLRECKTTVLGDLSSGSFTASGDNTGLVTMFRLEQSGDPNYLSTYTYRALVPAQRIVAGSRPFRIEVKPTNGEPSTSYISPALRQDLDLTAGKVEKFNITKAPDALSRR